MLLTRVIGSIVLKVGSGMVTSSKKAQFSWFQDLRGQENKKELNSCSYVSFWV